MTIINEGSASIYVPRQPMTKRAEAFYNPEMEYQRDITMSALRVFQKRAGPLAVCDPLAGTGVRSIRIAKEVPGIGSIVANDLNPLAVRVLKKNVHAQRLGRLIDIRNRNANDLFLEHPRGFDFIDIDPFGSPINYVFNSGYALKSRSMLACTATDTGALCGAFPSTCFSRYGIRAYKTDFYKELGVRVLTTSVMLELSKHGMAFTPAYAHANHYFRTIGQVRKSKSAVTEQFREIRFVFYCPSCLYRSSETNRECPGCGRRMHIMGPLWSGKIKDSKFCMEMLKELEMAGYRKTKELRTAIDEIDEPFYYDLHRLFRARRRSPKRMEDIMNTLEDSGFVVSRTRFSGTGLKTNAPYKKIISLL
ncbi:MAG: tRNA (guanine(10)-N(2))-dimethyltransferase [Candidatus Aenigmatarchaeota archaeon]|nr:MAG: tRNA (guanine(10)-N(2))-dimethyltransferase [Candidatus Aenigmarchaeota archaeon]